MQFINLTPHVVTFVNPAMTEFDTRTQGWYLVDEATDYITETIPPSGTIARCVQEEEVVGEVNNIPVIKLVTKELIGLPEPKEGTIYITSVMVAKEAGRDDVLAPAQIVRQKGTRNIVGCRALSKCN